MITDILYKIKRLKDGKYSTGGAYPYFTKTGKVWNDLKNLEGHIKMVKKNGLKTIYKDCIVERYAVWSYSPLY